MYITHLTKNRIVVGALLAVLLVSNLVFVGAASAGSLNCYAWGVLFEAGASGATGVIQIQDGVSGDVLATKHFELDPLESKSVTLYAAVPSGSPFAFASITSGSLSVLANGFVGDDFCISLLPGGADMVPIPADAAMGTFNTSTPLYFEPVAGAATSSVMDVGQSLWVYGLDASGAFYQVQLSGQLYWVPVGSIGPTYSAPWDGAPLPTTVVG